MAPRSGLLSLRPLVRRSCTATRTGCCFVNAIFLQSQFYWISPLLILSFPQHKFSLDRLFSTSPFREFLVWRFLPSSTSPFLDFSFLDFSFINFYLPDFSSLYFPFLDFPFFDFPFLDFHFSDFPSLDFHFLNFPLLDFPFLDINFPRLLFSSTTPYPQIFPRRLFPILLLAESGFCRVSVLQASIFCFYWRASWRRDLFVRTTLDWKARENSGNIFLGSFDLCFPSNGN